MRYYGNLTQEQIASHLGISQMHVSRLQARALARLRDWLTSPDHQSAANGRAGLTAAAGPSLPARRRPVSFAFRVSRRRPWWELRATVRPDDMAHTHAIASGSVLRVVLRLGGAVARALALAGTDEL